MTVGHDICRKGLVAAAVIVAVVGLVVPAGATEADMYTLPVFAPFRCLICHTTDPGETGDTALNSFGADFLDNTRLWDAALASLDSDNDGCANGVELGDADGDGQTDGGVTALQSNPGGAGDCGGSNLSLRTWGEMKALFDQN